MKRPIKVSQFSFRRIQAWIYLDHCRRDDGLLLDHLSQFNDFAGKRP